MSVGWRYEATESFTANLYYGNRIHPGSFKLYEDNLTGYWKFNEGIDDLAWSFDNSFPFILYGVSWAQLQHQ